MAEREARQAQELEEVKNAHEKLKIENEDYKRTLEFVIAGPCLIGLRGYSGETVPLSSDASVDSD